MNRKHAIMAVLMASSIAFCQEAQEQTKPEAASNSPVTYASRALLLLGTPDNGEPVMPLLVNGSLQFFPVSQAGDSIQAGSQVITLGTVLNALAELTQRNEQLQKENERLWRIAENGKPQTVVVQPAQAPTPDRRSALLQFLATHPLLYQNPQPLPVYQLPRRETYRPIPPNRQVNCTTTYTNSPFGNRADTSCQ